MKLLAEETTHTQQKEPKKDKSMKYIVRFASVDLDGNKPIYRALTKIKGIGNNLAMIFAKMFEKETGIAYNEKIGKLNEEQLALLESLIRDPKKYGMPEWCLNRRKGGHIATSELRIMSDLDFSIREDMKRLNEIKSYRGLRLAWGLPVRGQRTKSTHRGKGGVVGVLKKEARIAAAKQQSESKKESKKK